MNKMDNWVRQSLRTSLMIVATGLLSPVASAVSLGPAGLVTTMGGGYLTDLAELSADGCEWQNAPNASNCLSSESGTEYGTSASYSAVAAYKTDPRLPSYTDPYVSVSSTSAGNASPYAISNLSVSFELFAPGAGIVAETLDMTASGSTNASGYGGAYAELGISSGSHSNPTHVFTACIGSGMATSCEGDSRQELPTLTANGSAYTKVTGPITVYTNTLYWMEFSAFAYSGELLSYGKSGIGGKATAIFDPYLSIDAATAAALPNAQLIFSDGLQQASPVPLPASVYLLGPALISLVLTANRRRPC